MLAEFPELTLVRGHYVCPIWGLREHWWLVDSAGVVVDPTAEQFPSKGWGEYIPLPDNAPEPTGQCMNCGEYCYDGSWACSKSCNRLLEAYYNVKGPS